jgi:hypothetical protein
VGEFKDFRGKPQHQRASHAWLLFAPQCTCWRLLLVLLLLLLLPPLLPLLPPCGPQGRIRSPDLPTHWMVLEPVLMLAGS